MESVRLKPLMSTLARSKVIGAHQAGSAYEVAVQDIHWSHPGEIEVLSGEHCLLELASPPPPGAASNAQYFVQAGGGREYEVGELNFLPPGAALNVRWNAGRRQSIVCVMELERLGLLSSIAGGWGKPDPETVLDIRNDKLRTGMRWLAQEVEQPSFASSLQTHCLLTMLALELRRHCTAARQPAPCPSKGRLSTHLLGLVKDLVEASTDPAGPSLAELAAACGLSSRDLSTMFKNTTGRTLRSYVATRHIARAKVLLADGDLLVKQVAYRSGFRSAAAFGEAFRRATGLTPLQYRELHELRTPPEGDEAE